MPKVRSAIRLRTATLCRAGLVAFGVFCAGSTSAEAQTQGVNEGQRYPNVLAAKVRPGVSGGFDFDVSVSSPYDSAQRYADAFRVAGRDGQVYGERKLLHDHAGEQPFTRELYGVNIPLRVQTVVIQARDRKYGYGGRTVEAVLPGR